jgi:hypothetical protein
MEVSKSFQVSFTIFYGKLCNLPSKTESKEGVGEKSEEKRTRKNANNEGV